MDASPKLGTPASPALLTLILKAIRRRRGLSSNAVARAMGMPLRTYNHFESAAGRLKPETVHRFARAVDADGHAILLALEIGAPELALYCMDNKMVRILWMQVQDFYAATGADMERLDAHTLIAFFSRTFNELTATARDHQAYVERWMNDRSLGGRPDDED